MNTRDREINMAGNYTKAQGVLEAAGIDPASVVTRAMNEKGYYKLSVPFRLERGGGWATEPTLTPWPKGFSYEALQKAMQADVASWNATA